ncbi:nucleoside deaminase [Dactylosporangium sp. CS-047395]|uniref:nucleoside deaminase n=1 Tax=Dactylosporangium sp. CS-047395 TaxID=3239936 RepID=UPI003D8DED7F
MPHAGRADGRGAGRRGRGARPCPADLAGLHRAQIPAAHTSRKAGYNPGNRPPALRTQPKSGLRLGSTRSAGQGLAAGELPIGAVVEAGGVVLGRAYTSERALGRRIVHGDLLALTQADEALGSRRGTAPIRMAVTLEPCLMCLGAAMVLGVAEVYYAHESPPDGGAGVAAAWRTHPEAPWFAAPVMTAGVRRDEAVALFETYVRQAPPGGMRDWARALIGRRSGDVI